jgi:CRISPR-associated protein Csb2
LFALGIRYLNGFAAASEPDARDRPEWPPHPARVFMALVAAHFETGADSSERVALEWIETLSPPRLRGVG